MIKVKKIVETCGACPAQWEGSLEDGRTIYIRYRYGYLAVRVSLIPTEDVWEAVRGEEIFGTDYGDAWDGCMDMKVLAKLTEEILDWSEVVYY